MRINPIGAHPWSSIDLSWIKDILRPSLSYRAKKNTVVLSVLDPCAGPGNALAVVRQALRRATNTAIAGTKHDVELLTYAVEANASQYDAIEGVTQKVKGSFFDTTVMGRFGLVLLNPYHGAPQQASLTQWLERVTSMMYGTGRILLALPRSVWDDPASSRAILDHTLPEEAFLSDDPQSDQVIAILRPRFYNAARPRVPQPEVAFSAWDHYRRGYWTIDVPHVEDASPVLVSGELEKFYDECGEKAHKVGLQTLERVYPRNYDAALRPVATLRTAHAVQLAAMGAQVDAVTINGTPYLARYRVNRDPIAIEDEDPHVKHTVLKPRVDAYLMDTQGRVLSVGQSGYDPYALNRELSAVLLKRLTSMFLPLHEIGTDEGYLAAELGSMGLLPPQREAVKALAKLYRAGYKGAILRANTGTGKTWMARGVIASLQPKRSVLITEPHLIPQMVQEFEPHMPVHVVNSWKKVEKLAQERPEGLYLVSYTRLRSAPPHRPATIVRRVRVKERGRTRRTEARASCPTCFTPLARWEVPTKNAQAKCGHCGAPLWAHRGDSLSTPSFGRWDRLVRSGRAIPSAKTTNRNLPFLRHLRQIPFDLAIVDEAHNASNMKSQQGEAFIRLAAKAARVLCLTATLTNGTARSLYNILWAVTPDRMDEEGWDRDSAAAWQKDYGATKITSRLDVDRHRWMKSGESDIAGIHPGLLAYLLPVLVNVDEDDFDDLPPVERHVIRTAPHPGYQKGLERLNRVLENVAEEDLICAAGVRTSTALRLSDTLPHYDDPITVRGQVLGTVPRVNLNGALLDKERELVNIAKQVKARGERVLIYTGVTQHCDLRPVLRKLLEDQAGVSVQVLVDSVAPDKVVAWLQDSTATAVVVSYKRAGTGLNLSQFNNVVWYDYTANSRLADQGEGRPRRVNTAAIHLQLFGEIRPVRYYYLTSSPAQEMQLSYTLEKRMTAKLAEGEIPDIDPNDCDAGVEQSFSALLTKALQEGQFSYRDPSEMLKRMTQTENSRVRPANLRPTPTIVAVPAFVAAKLGKRIQLSLF